MKLRTVVFFFSPVSLQMVCNVISSLKNKNAYVATFPTSILKYIAPIVSLPISVLISKSLSTGHFPDSMKVARVVPLKKPGDPTEMGNYRPISILPIISKVFEKVAIHCCVLLSIE